MKKILFYSLLYSLLVSSSVIQSYAQSKIPLDAYKKLFLSAMDKVSETIDSDQKDDADQKESGCPFTGYIISELDFGKTIVLKRNQYVCFYIENFSFEESSNEKILSLVRESKNEKLFKAVDSGKTTLSYIHKIKKGPLVIPVEGSFDVIVN